MKQFLSMLCVALFIATTVLAQTSQALAPDLSVSTIPIDPKPGDNVRVSVQSYAVDLDQASISWKYNGVVVGSGTGLRTISVIAPSSGAVGTVTVTVSALGSPQANATLVLRPASIDVLWEAPDAYTPPFYKGRALLPVSGALKAVAIPTANAPKQIAYRWSENGSALQTQSGYNKNSILVTPDSLIPTENISVSADSGTFAGNGSISVTSRQPSVVAYLKSEGFTDYANGFSTSIIAHGTGATVRFEPYYFSAPTSISADLSFETKVDGSDTIGEPINELRFSKPNDNVSAAISVAVSTALYTLQNVTKTFTLSFN